DANNNPVATAGKTVTWTKTGAGGSLASAISTTDASGMATVVFTTGPTPATYTITATDNTGLTGTSGNITTIALPAAKYLVSSSNNSPLAGSAIAITAQLADANNNPVATPGKTVTWTKTAAGGSFGSATSTTEASAKAT